MKRELVGGSWAMERRELVGGLVGHEEEGAVP
jgi:hypothetical protein